MDDFSTTHHVPGAFPETRIALPQKRERTTALPQIFVTPSSSLRPLDAPARSHMQDIEPPSSQRLVQFGEPNDDIPLPIYPVAPRLEDCPTTQTMDSSLKATPYFDGKLSITRSDVDAVSDELVDQLAVNALNVQDHHNPQNNTSQDCASCSSLKTQNTMLKQLVEEVQAERDEALSSVGSLQRWLYQARRDAGLDVHGQDLDMAAKIPTTHQFTDFQCDAAPNKKIRTLEAKVADLTEQLHNAGKLLQHNKMKDELMASFETAFTAPPARDAMPPAIPPPYDLSDTAATLFALSERHLWSCANEVRSVQNEVLNRLAGLPPSDIDARIGELRSAIYNEAQARAQVEEMAKSAERMAAAGAEQAPFDEDGYRMMRSQIERFKYERIRNMVTDFQSTEEHVEEQIKTLDKELSTILAVNVPTPLEKSFSRLYMSAGLLKGYLYELHHLRRNFSMVRSGSGYETVSARLEVLREKLRKEAHRRRQAWALFTTTEAQSPVPTWFDYEEPIFDYAVIAEHSHEYQTTVTVEESEDDQMGLLTAFSDTVSDGPDELVTYYTSQHFHDYRTAVAVGKPEGSQMGLSTAFSETSSDDFDELVTYYTPQASDDEGD
ncbi:hypothetical protein D6D19_07677 [Aureobasidium pullulans]|uniref:Uncharacterized protein n=1 Tax=Aureobasidium pullulans TaxID=5580 RepID=A0A4S8ZW46_AURPU|nr:hypothetical protein D6D19_07677 [Aureobasidium pullulans]